VAPPATYPPAASTIPPATAYPGAPAYSPAQPPPATAYPVTPTYPANPAPLTTPPGGWNTYPPQAQLAPSGAVQTPNDQLPLRFAPQQIGQSTSTAGLPAPAFAPNAGAQLASAPIAPQQLQAREVTPAEYLAPEQQSDAASSASVAATGRDGFRPQS